MNIPCLTLGAALRKTFRNGYSLHDLAQDLGAGLVVGIIAIPLSMALAMATGVAPQHGLYTAIVAGVVTALLGGSKVQVTGPTAAFVVILAPVSARFGLGGLLTASLMAGMILYLFGLTGLGRLIEFVPYPVTAGFTAGIAVVIATLQVKDALGLQIVEMPETYLGKVSAICNALPTIQVADFAVAGATLLLLIIVPRLLRQVPGPLVVLPVATLGCYVAHRCWPAFEVSTIHSRFSYVRDGLTMPGIPSAPPMFQLPWDWPGGTNGPFMLTFDTIHALVPIAFTIALLAAIESLLSAVIADGMTGRKHNPDAELMALGLGNIACSFFGGFAATGAIARTATNIRFGARSPIAAIIHALVVLLAMVAAAPLLGHLPIAALAALLLVVAWNMSEARHFVYVTRIAPRSDVAVLLTCFTLTIVFDMVVAVTVGMVLASLLFIRRMAEVSSVTLVSQEDVRYPKGLRQGVVIYEIAGPLFFGAAEKAMSSLKEMEGEVKMVVLDFRKIPMMDITGLINLQSALARLQRQGIRAVLAGVQGQPLTTLNRAGWAGQSEHLAIYRSFEEALDKEGVLQPDDGSVEHQLGTSLESST